MTAKAPNEPPVNVQRRPAPAVPPAKFREGKMRCAPPPPPGMRQGNGARVPLPGHRLNTEDEAHNEQLRAGRHRGDLMFHASVLALLALLLFCALDAARGPYG